MKVVALVSGGKDSTFNMMHCVANGHSIVALANLTPQDLLVDELDSYMYQTVGHDLIGQIAECMELPLFRQPISGRPIAQGDIYDTTLDDEVEDLYTLLSTVKKNIPEIQAVSVGAILSNYQRIRVEHVCSRLGLTVLGYLWRQDQSWLLSQMIHSGVEAILIKVAAMGLEKRHLGLHLKDMESELHSLKYRDKQLVVTHSDDAFAPVLFLKVVSSHLEEKNKLTLEKEKEMMTSLQTWQHPFQPFDKAFKEMNSLKGRVPFQLKSAGALQLNPTPLVYNKEGLFYSFNGIRGKENSIPDLVIEEETFKCLNNLNTHLQQEKLTKDDIVMVRVYVANMDHFQRINNVYKEFFGVNPPPRALIQVPLEDNRNIQLDVTVCIKPCSKLKFTLHVQGISYWAPANIGPYSQACTIHGHSFLAGQIGLIPGSMNPPVPSSSYPGWNQLQLESVLCLRNLFSVITTLFDNMATCPSPSLSLEVMLTTVKQSTALAICFMTNLNEINFIRQLWSHHQGSWTRPLLCIQVPQLPRHCLVEWQLIIEEERCLTDPFPNHQEQVAFCFDNNLVSRHIYYPYHQGRCIFMFTIEKACNSNQQHHEDFEIGLELLITKACQSLDDYFTNKSTTLWRPSVGSATVYFATAMEEKGSQSTLRNCFEKVLPLESGISFVPVEKLELETPTENSISAICVLQVACIDIVSREGERG